MRITRRLEFDAGHRIPDHASQCRHLHGHRYALEITLSGDIIRADGLPANGMVVDFTKIKDVVNLFDHRCANDIMEGLNPTAENMAKWLCDRIPHCIRVAVQETEGNTAVYEK